MLGASPNRILFQAIVIRELRGAAIEKVVSKTFKRVVVDIGLFQQQCANITGNHDTTVVFIACKSSCEEMIG